MWSQPVKVNFHSIYNIPLSLSHTGGFLPPSLLSIHPSYFQMQGSIGASSHEMMPQYYPTQKEGKLVCATIIYSYNTEFRCKLPPAEERNHHRTSCSNDLHSLCNPSQFVLLNINLSAHNYYTTII